MIIIIKCKDKCFAQKEMNALFYYLYTEKYKNDHNTEK